MNKCLTTLLLVATVAVGIFGFLGMDMATEHGTTCIASVINASPCPTEGIGSALYHARVFASFSLAVVTAFVLFGLLALVFIAHTRPFTPPRSVSVRHHIHAPVEASPRKFLRRLSLFENSPGLSR